MKVAVIQSNYLPWKGYFDIIHDADFFCFYDEVQYTKNDWRNRNRIYSKNGLSWLTIPIDKSAVKQKISEVKLSDGDWRKKHFNSLFLSYKKAPFFNQLEPFIIDWYEKNNSELLSEFNRSIIQSLSKYIGIETTFVNSADYQLSNNKISRLLNLLTQLNCTEYFSGPSAYNYLKESEKDFFESGIKITYKNYENYPAYKQLTEPFENAVSIVDLIANIHQDEIKNYIWTWRNRENK